MGLLDWGVKVHVDDFEFPNFDSSFSPVSSTVDKSRESESVSPTHCSNYSAITRSSSNSSTSSTSTTSSTSSSSSNSPIKHSKARLRSTSFDLFGDDEELQEAEPRIGFCDICLKDCDIH